MCVMYKWCYWAGDGSRPQVVWELSREQVTYNSVKVELLTRQSPAIKLTKVGGATHPWTGAN